MNENKPFNYCNPSRAMEARIEQTLHDFFKLNTDLMIIERFS